MPHSTLWVMATALLTALTSSLLGPVNGPSSTAAQQEDAAQIRDLAERLLTYPYGTGAGDPARAQLIVGRLPADFPFPLPMPPGGRLVGSAVRTAGTEMMSIEAAIEAPGTPAQIVTFYDTALPAAGLSLAPTSYSGGGGFQSGSAKRSDTFCLGETGPWLTLSAAEQAGSTEGRSDVRVSVSMRVATVTPLPTSYAGPCSTQGAGYSYGYGSAPGRLLPRLSGPTGVPMQTSGMNMGQDYVASSVTATTAMSVSELEAYFAGQLAAAGWARRAGGAEGPAAWSLWALPDEGEWQGFLTVVTAPGENRRRLSLLVESAATGGTGTGIIGPAYYPFSVAP